jgi:hypothetical protein
VNKKKIADVTVAVAMTCAQVFTISGSFQIRACVKDYHAGTTKTCGGWINGS